MQNGAPVPHPWCCLERQNNAGLRGADSPRLSMSHWADSLTWWGLRGERGQEPEERTLVHPERLLIALFQDILCRSVGPEMGRTGHSASHFTDSTTETQRSSGTTMVRLAAQLDWKARIQCYHGLL